jgi:folate-dependent phosphoribosylglycinamide formyltransferase PurN
VPVLRSDDAEALHARIQRAEHALLPAVVDAIARGEIVLGEVPRYVGSESDPTRSMCWPPLLSP